MSNIVWLVFSSLIYTISLSFIYFSKTRLNNGENKIYKDKNQVIDKIL